ncbi:hypothetical protein [Pseudofrankia sp. BMG5.36]|uniref:hypothetical protein n=1 Tax=Pseudofrankia sp. BMG5.36 TaxID=1834512 RepID=UPI0008D9D0F4|nr:hypothetical protein [Pseudofrankia sp. BMG5.36]OHV43458.1 hypothetical protein BCD48_28245 [Pseudofrankia sp. BMG5.36]
MISYPNSGNAGLRRTGNAPASAASGVVEACAAMHFASSEYGKHVPRWENLAAAGGRAETR